MPDDAMGTSDEAVVTLQTSEAPIRKKFKVLSEAGLFKNGEHYPKGSSVELDEVTAARFRENGDVE